MADPIHQFEIKKLAVLGNVGGHEIAFTNSALFMAITVVGIWALPLFLLCVLRAWKRQSRWWGAGAGVCLAAVACTDYYYAVYCGVAAAGRQEHFAAAVDPNIL